MYTFMYHQMTLLTKCLITYLTGIWTLATVDALMSDQIILMTESLITHKTGIWPLPTMYALLMYLHRSLISECLCTHTT